MRLSLKKVFTYVPILLLCAVMASISIRLLSRAGIAADRYGPLEKSFFTGYGLWIVLGASLLFLVIVEIYSLFEHHRKKPYLFIWIISVILFCINFFILYQANSKLFKYEISNSEVYFDISLEDLEYYRTAPGISYIYVSRDDCGTCTSIEPDLKNFLYEKQIHILHYSTSSDRNTRAEYMSSVLDSYGIKGVPIIIKISHGEIVATIQEKFPKQLELLMFDE